MAMYTSGKSTSYLLSPKTIFIIRDFAELRCLRSFHTQSIQEMEIYHLVDVLRKILLMIIIFSIFFFFRLPNLSPLHRLAPASVRYSMRAQRDGRKMINKMSQIILDLTVIYDVEWELFLINQGYQLLISHDKRSVEQLNLPTMNHFKAQVISGLNDCEKNFSVMQIWLVVVKASLKLFRQQSSALPAPFRFRNANILMESRMQIKTPKLVNFPSAQ